MKRGFTKQDFYDKLQPAGECLEWTASCNQSGYGHTLAWGKLWRTNRLALELEGISTAGHMVLHSCDNPCCCNPKHLRLGTHAENMRDMVSRGRQQKACGANVNGAKLTEQDVYKIRAITGMKQKDIAEQYGVTQPIISKIINRKRWPHI